MLCIEPSTRQQEGHPSFRHSDSAVPPATWHALSRAFRKDLTPQQEEHDKPKQSPRYKPNPAFSRVETELSTIEHAFDTHNDNAPVVLKRLNSPSTAEHELHILRKMSEAKLPHVLRLRDTFEDPVTGERVLVFPELQQLNSRKLDLIQVAKYIKQLATGLKAAHAIRLAHLDISLSNLMLDNKGDLVIIDWGLARFCDPSQSHPMGRGTPGYVAPEMYTGTATCTAPDIYSAGVVMGQWLEPYLTGCSLSYLGSKLVRSSTTSFITRKIQDHLDSQRLGYAPPWCPVVTHAAELLMQMLEADPTRRAKADDILHHPFITAAASDFEGTDYEAHAKLLLKQSICGGRCREGPTIIYR